MGDLNYQRQHESLGSSANFQDSNKSNVEQEQNPNLNPVAQILSSTANLTRDILDLQTNRIQLDQYTIQSKTGVLKVSFEGNNDQDQPISSIKVTLQDGSLVEANFNQDSFSKSHIAKVLDFLIQAANKYQNLDNLKEFLVNVMKASIEFLF